MPKTLQIEELSFDDGILDDLGLILEDLAPEEPRRSEPVQPEHSFAKRAVALGALCTAAGVVTVAYRHH